MKLDWHAAATIEIALDLGFSPCSALCLALGNVSIDLLDFDDVIKHGMTPADDQTGEPTEDPARAEAEWADWIEDAVNDGLEDLDDGDCCGGLFRLGQALHSLQDVEAHKGMTNPEHARQMVCGEDPDTDPRAKVLGREVTRAFLKAFLESRNEDEVALVTDCDCDLEIAEDLLEDFSGVAFARSVTHFGWLGVWWCWFNRTVPARIRW